ncbi:MAG: TRAP transporter substrate-binding protein [Kangiellaceae bacterium]|nr:TRAP transporter substrate-binding protein [Kangiellaceae bacterium]
MSRKTIRIGLITPPPHMWTQSAQQIAKSIQEKYPGEFEVSIFPSGQLGNEAQMLQLLQTGAIDFAFLTTSELANRLVEFSAFYTPYLVSDSKQAACLLSGKTAQQILKSTEKLGLVGMGIGMAGMRQIVARDLVLQQSDLQGLKVRVTPDLPLTDFWKLADTAPTAIPLSGLFDAFTNGQVDAMHIDFENTLRLKFYEHAKSVLQTDHMIFPMVALASAKSWRQLESNQKNYLKILFEQQLKQLRDGYSEADRKFKLLLIERGVNVISLDQEFFANASKLWLDRWQNRTPYVNLLKQEAMTIKQSSSCDLKGKETKQVLASDDKSSKKIILVGDVKSE